MRRYALGCVLVVVLSSSFMAAQVSPDLEQGMKPYGSYHGGAIDQISLTNGNLFFEAPLFAYSQRGDLSYPIVLRYNNKNFSLYQLQPPCPPGTPPQQCPLRMKMIFGPNPLRNSMANQGSGVSLGFDGFPGTGTGKIDTGLSFNGNEIFVNPTSVLMPDGSTHQLAATDNGMFAIDGSGYSVSNAGNLSGSDETTYAPFGNFTEDGNGNQISTTNSAWVDTLGRQIPFMPGPSTPISTPPTSTAPLSACPALNYAYQPVMSAYSWDLPGPNTAPSTGSIRLIACYTSVFVRTGTPDTPPIFQVSQSFNLLQSVVFPDNTYWAFKYDAADPNNNASFAFGDLLKVTFPTGGSITYTWGLAGYGCGSGVDRAVLTRTVDANDGTGPHTWTYGNGTGVVTDPLGNDTVHGVSGLGRTCSLYETQTQYYQGSHSGGTLLKTVNTDYQYTINPYDPVVLGGGVQADAGSVTNVFPIRVTTTLPNGLVSKVETVYDNALAYHGALDGITSNIKTCPATDPGGNNNSDCHYYFYGAQTTNPVTNYTASYGKGVARREFGWGQGAPGSLLRQTLTTYQWQVNSAYLKANLLNLPATVKVYDGAGTLMAQTTYGYDESPLGNSSISTQHDANPFNGSTRGNQTSVHRWLNTTNTTVDSSATYFDTGELKSSTDPLGHTTTHLYDTAYAGAYSTQTCSPSTNGGAITHCVSGTYDFSTGQLTSLTNENATTQASGNTPGDPAHTTSLTYDNYWRLTQALAPPDPANSSAQASTTFLFPAQATFPEYVTRKRSITSALTDFATSYFDGVGRPYQSDHITSGGTAEVLTAYDKLGQVATVTNPYYVGTNHATDPTYGITQTQYDALGRVTQVTRQDGSISKIKYNVTSAMARNGDCSITTDEAGQQRGACTDALGRLIEVDEPPASGVVVANYHAVLDTTGNFVLENAANASLWSSGTSGSNASSIFMQDDGNLVLYIFQWSAGVYAAGSPGPFPASSCSIGTYLVAGQTLPSGKCIVSPHGQYFLYMSPDGNLYIYDWAHATGTWGPGTQGHPGAYAVLQMDGNFVVYAADNTYLWSSGTGGSYAERLNLEDDGRIILYRSAWNSGTSTGQFNWSQLPHPGCDVGIGTGTTGILGSGQCFVSPNGHFELLLQSDGSMVIYDLSVTPNAARWSTPTALSPVDPSVALRTLYTYDTLGNLLRVDQKGSAPNDSTQWRTRTFTYDSLSRLLTATNPESGTITYTYDLDGNLLKKTSPAANQTGTATQTVTYCYDELNRVTGKGYGTQSCPLSSPVVSYVYDSGANAKGKLTTMTDQAGTATYSYDILGRLATETRTLMGSNPTAISQTMSYEYNLDGSLKTLHYPSGAAVTYTPDSAGRMLSAIDSGHSINYVTGATYGPDSGLTGFVSGNSATFAGITNAFSYNKRLQPLTMSATAPSQTVFSIGYDFHLGNGTTGSDNGNVWGIYNYRDRTRDQAFTYDALNRLTSAQNAGTDCNVNVLGGNKKFWGNTYGYDAWGNLTNKTKIPTACAGENLGINVDVTNRLLSGYLYDAAGNMTYDATSGLNYNFDQENRITGANGYTYTYDGDGNRVSKSNGTAAGNGTLYWYMTPGVVAETDLAGTLKSEYVFFDGERVARRDGVNGAGGVAYYFSDHLKTASVITDSAGVIKAESDYYPWGGELQFVNNDSNDYKFTGKKRDSETGLDYFGARYYSNALGRWVSPDWAAKAAAVPYAEFADPQSLNLYTYVRNIPTVKVDADGHCGDDACLAQHSDNDISLLPHDLGTAAVGFAKQLGNIAIETLHAISGGAIDGSYSINGHDEKIGANAANVAVAVAPILEEEAVGSTVNRVAGEIEASSVGEASRAGVGADPTPAPYSRSEHYGNPASSAAAQEIRGAGEGKPCPSCGETMKSGTKTAPTAEHQPTLKSHYYNGGHKMTAAERRAYARSSKSMQKDAVCKSCQSKQGAAEKNKQYPQ